MWNASVAASQLKSDTLRKPGQENRSTSERTVPAFMRSVRSVTLASRSWKRMCEQVRKQVVSHERAIDLVETAMVQPDEVHRVVANVYVVGAKNETDAKKSVKSRIENAEIVLVDNDP